LRPDLATEAFLAHRNLLFTVVYEMLDSAAGAEDVPAEDPAAVGGRRPWSVRDQRAYLVRITIRQALSRLRILGVHVRQRCG
jgi:DNA-directed RNA polymerase specialized sigma24 family protein